MELAFRVVQSSSILHGVHWGRFLPDTDCLVVVKAHLLELFQLTQEEKPLYCMLEQTLGFQVASSAKLSQSQQDFLILTTNGIINVMEFTNDYFKVIKKWDSGLNNIEKIENFEGKLLCSDNQKNFLVLDSESLTLLQRFEYSGSIIDWNVVDKWVLVLEYECLEKRMLWERVSLDRFERKELGRFEELDNFPRCFLCHSGKILLFSEEKLTVIGLADLEVKETRTLKGFYSSSTTIGDVLYICIDEGSVYTYTDKLKELEIRLQEDSLILNINSLLFFISHHGQSGLLSDTGSLISRNFRSGNFIDGFFLDSWEDTDFQSFLCASVNFNTSEIIRICKRTCDTYQQLCVPDICKYTTCTSTALNYLFLMPDLKIINLQTFELVPVESVSLLNERTWVVWNVGEDLGQVTDKCVYFKQKQEFVFEALCSAAHYKDNIIVVGLVSEKILILDNLQQKAEISNVDFSILHLSEKREIFVGLQQTGIQKYSLFGELLEKIDSKGIPQSYLEHFGKVFVGNRDGVLQVFTDGKVINKKLGHNPLNLSRCSKGVLAVAGKSYLIYNEELDIKKINYPDCKLIVESDLLIGISKDLSFFNFEDDLRFSTTQEVLFSVPGQINRMVKVDHDLICCSYFKDDLTVLSVFKACSLQEKSSISISETVTSMVYDPFRSLILVGTSKKRLIFYNNDLTELVSHSFPYEITAIHPFNSNGILIASSWILFQLDFPDIYNPVKLQSEKFHSIITEILVQDHFVILALNTSGIYILNLENLETISASRRKLDIKKILFHHQKIFAISIDGWVLTKALEDNSEFLTYTGSGGRVMVSGSLYDSNIQKRNTENITVASFNGEILEMYPELDKEVCGKAQHLFKDLQDAGIIDPSQAKELNLDILRLVLKLSSLDQTDQSVQKLLRITN